MRCTAVLLTLLLGCSAPAVAQTAKPEPKEGPVTILDGTSVWRVLHSWAPVQVRTGDGLRRWYLKRRRGVHATEQKTFRFMTLYPEAGWTGTEFDGTGWARAHFYRKPQNTEWDARAGGNAGSPYLRQLTLRGKFTVADPGRVRDLTLTVGYYGGLAAYVNGTEVARRHLAASAAPGAAAEPYPREASLKPDGKPWHWYSDRQAVRKKAYPLRRRRIENVPISTKLLRKGTNVLAVEIHAAPWPEEFLTKKLRPPWATCGLIELRLQAPSPEGVEPNVLRPRGLQVWNTNLIEQVYDASWCDPHEPLRPIRLAGPRNGSFTGRVVLSSDRPIEGLAGQIEGLSGPDGARVAADALHVRFGAFTGAGSRRVDLRGGRSGLYSRRDDALLDQPLAVIPVAKKTVNERYRKEREQDGLPPTLRDGAVQPVYLTVRIPKGAAPGDYTGTLTLRCKGEDPVSVPIELTVVEWTLPDPHEFTYWCGLIQSTEGPGAHYAVPMWGPKHLELIGKSFDWVAKLGSRVLIIPLHAECEYGNAESTVLWIRQADGSYQHDFSRVEKYLDVALEHLGRPRFTVFGVWHFSDPRTGRPRVSVRDPDSGKVRTVEGPKHGSPESEAFWKPVLTRIRELLRERKIDDTMLLGYKSDRTPSKATVGVFRRILPGVGWMCAQHAPRGNTHMAYKGGRVPVMYHSNVWGCGNVVDPSVRRVYGWNHKYPVEGGLRTWLDRSVYDPASLTTFRGMSENILLSNRPGQGQIGADFWPPPPAKGRRPIRSLYNRYPHSANAGGGNKGCTTNRLLFPGPDGAVPTLRFLMMQENIQECEARIFLEKLLLAKRLPAELAAKSQAVLDERTRWQRLQKVGSRAYLAWPYSGWPERTLQLYQAAARAAQAAPSR
jgi:hypothetical protein